MGQLIRAWQLTGAEAVSAMDLLTAISTGAATSGGTPGGTSIIVTIVANPQMQDVETLTRYFERCEPDMRVHVTLPENEARRKPTEPVAARSREFDTVMAQVAEAIAGFTEWATECAQRNAAMWCDVTSAAGLPESPASSIVASKVGYVTAPVEATASAGWLYRRSLGIPSATVRRDSAWPFGARATSRDHAAVPRPCGTARPADVSPGPPTFPEPSGGSLAHTCCR